MVSFGDISERLLYNLISFLKIIIIIIFTQHFSIQDHNIKIRQSNVAQYQVGFHHMLYCRALGNSNIISHFTTALLFITNLYR